MTEGPEGRRDDDRDGRRQLDGDKSAAISWLESQFPEWSVDVESAATWTGAHRPVWIARSDGHHPQAELSAGKLHTRLSEYLDRERTGTPAV